MKAQFFGTDASIEISIFEYGLLVKKVSRYQYKIIYGIDTDESGNYVSFNTTIMTHRDIVCTINENWFVKNGFFSFVGSNEKDWLDTNIANQLFDLRQYYGVENIFGSSPYSITKDDVTNLIKTG